MILKYPQVDERLPFPTKPLRIGEVEIEEYIIPEECKEKVLADLYLFMPVPSLDEEFFDLHSERRFKVREFRVTREAGRNWLVSPYYEDGGGTVIDWVPVEFIEGEEGENGAGNGI